MPAITPRSKPTQLIAILIIATLAITGCAGLQTAGQPGGSLGDDAFEEIDLSGEGDVAGYPDDGEDSPSPDDMPVVQAHCPAELTEFVLFLTHSWDFSPNRELDKIKVSGQTQPSSPCPFSVAGSTVIMEECRVSITNTGFIQTDDGPCDITASGTALVMIDDAACLDGVITMTIEESLDPDSGSGAMNCPNRSQPYFPFYPFSRTTREFQIQMGGATATEAVDPDLSGQFMYNKAWTVHSEKLGTDLP